MKMWKIEKYFVNSPSHSRRVAELAERRCRLVNCNPKDKYLDVGCGNGAAAVQLASSFGLDVTGVDIDEEQILIAHAAAQGAHNVRFLKADATSLPFEDGHFELVAANKALHHISEWRVAVGEMIRVLKPDGYFILGDLVLPKWVAVLGKFVAGKRAGLLTREELQKLLAAGGLEVVHCSAQGTDYSVICRRRRHRGQAFAGAAEV